MHATYAAIVESKVRGGTRPQCIALHTNPWVLLFYHMRVVQRLGRCWLLLLLLSIPNSFCLSFVCF